MRVLECNICGEPLAAANDDELVVRLLDHMGQEHADSEPGFDEGTARETVAREAYDASDN